MKEARGREKNRVGPNVWSPEIGGEEGCVCVAHYHPSNRIKKKRIEKRVRFGGVLVLVLEDDMCEPPNELPIQSF